MRSIENRAQYSFFEIVKYIFTTVTFASVIFYIFGFLIWNTFLYALRFNDTAILETRYIYTGFFFVLFIIIALLIVSFIYFFLKPHISKIWENTSLLFNKTDRRSFIYRFVLIIVLSLFCLFVLFVYSVLIFPNMSRVIGGGRPQSISLLMGEGAMSLKYLGNFGIQPGRDSLVQTENLCIAYDNAEAVLVLLPDRTLQINKSKLNGVAVLPIGPIHQIEKTTCAQLLGINLMTGFNMEQGSLTRSVFEWAYDFKITGLNTNQCKITTE